MDEIYDVEKHTWSYITYFIFKTWGILQILSMAKNTTVFYSILNGKITVHSLNFPHMT